MWPSWRESHRTAATMMPKKILDTNDQLLNALRAGSETLQNITDQFAPLMKNLRVYFFWEQEKTDLGYTRDYVRCYRSSLEESELFLCRRLLYFVLISNPSSSVIALHPLNKMYFESLQPPLPSPSPQTEGPKLDPSDEIPCPTQIVHESSAAPLLDDTERAGIPAPHALMCKFSHEHSPGYRTLVAALLRYAREAPDAIETRWKRAGERLDGMRREEAEELRWKGGAGSEGGVMG